MSERAAGEVKIILTADAATYSAALEKAKQQMKQLEGAVGDAGKTTRKEMSEARGSVALLGEELGIHLPRHVRSFIAELPGAQAALAAAFSGVAVAAIGVALFEAGKKIVEFGNKAQDLANELGTGWLDGAVLQLEGYGKAVEEQAKKTAEFQKQSEEYRKHTGALLLQQLGMDFGPAVEKTRQAQLLEEQAAGLRSMLPALREQLSVAQYEGDPGRRGRAWSADDARMGELARQYGMSERVAMGPVQIKAAQAQLDSTLAKIDELRTQAQTLYREAEQNGVPKVREGVGGAAGAVANPWAGLSSPNTSTFYTPIRDAVRATLEAQAGYRRDEAAAEAEDAKRMAPAFTAWLNSMQFGGATSAFGAPAGVPYGGLGPAAEGAKVALDDLAKSFTDVTGVMHDTVVNTINEFNDAVARAVTTGHGNFGEMARGMAGGLTKSGLQMLEGAGLKALGFGKRDGSSPTSAIYTINATGLPGTAVPGASSALGKLGGWLSGIFPHFAAGGEIPTNMPSIVGENGPEMFMPRTPGWIVPNSRLGTGSQITMYNDCRGTDPALTSANLARMFTSVHNQAVTNAAVAMADAQRRRPR